MGYSDQRSERQCTGIQIDTTLVTNGFLYDVSTPSDMRLEVKMIQMIKCYVQMGQE